MATKVKLEDKVFKEKIRFHFKISIFEKC